jgi:hypothetical protein
MTEESKIEITDEPIAAGPQPKGLCGLTKKELFIEAVLETQRRKGAKKQNLNYLLCAFAPLR